MPTRRITGDAYTDLTGADITTIQFQNIGNGEVRVVRSDTQPEPDTEDAWEYLPHEGERGELSRLYPASTGARLWFISPTETDIRYVYT